MNTDVKKIFSRNKSANRQADAAADSSAQTPEPDGMNQTAPAERTARRRQPIVGRLDRYIIYKFLSTYIFLITIIVVIAVVFDFNERIDKLTQSHAPVQKIIFDYYVNFVPNFVNLFTPLFVFIAVIFFTSKLADNSEIIAMKSTGMSFRRLLRPYMISAALIAASSFLLGAFVIPQSNVARVNFENRYIKKKTDVTSVDNVQMQVDTEWWLISPTSTM